MPPFRLRSARLDRDRSVRLLWCAIDGSAWIVGILVATWLRYQFHLPAAFSAGALTMAGVGACMHMMIGFTVGPYRKGHHRGSFEEVFDVMLTATMTALLLSIWALSIDPLLTPRTVPLLGGALALNLMLSTRFVLRALNHRRIRKDDRRERVIIFGAGSGGRLLIRNLIADDKATFKPVAVLDDDPRKRWLSIDGVSVRGGRAHMASAARVTRAQTLIIAVPSLESDVLRELNQTAEGAGLRVKVVPSLSELMHRAPVARDIRDINLEDLLGRRRITLDQTAIGNQLRGRRVLVTGAGGSIGSELCRQIALFDPAQLVLLDRDESALQATQISMEGHGLLQNDNIVLADIRDAAGLRRIFDRHRPDIVFHAAALKHLPLLESHPLEAWMTNVHGTLNVLRAAVGAGVTTLVNISTDKAADPTCVLGYSKRIAERLTAHIAERENLRYMSVRFGNVLGSRGSVIPTFAEQIRTGGPVTVTDPDVERYFMLIPEACQLVMQAGVIGKVGEVMVLDMGEPVKISRIAQNLIDMSGRDDIEIVYTGLRPGEKMSEDLFNRTDTSRVTEHPLVTSTEVPPLDAHDLDRVDWSEAGVAHWMRNAALVSSRPPVQIPTAGAHSAASAHQA